MARGIVLGLLAFFLPACHDGGGGGGGTSGVYPPFLRHKGFDLHVQSLATALDGSGDVYVGGMFNTYDAISSRRIARLNADAILDTAFGVGTGFSSLVTAIAPVADGSGDIYVGGIFSIYNGASVNALVRLNNDGSIDPAFSMGAGFDGGVESIALAADGSGDLYVGGGFTSYNGTPSNRIIRLNSDGTVDTAFAVGTGFDSAVLSLTPATDGSGDLYVGGGFTSYNGTPSNRIIRLNSDGTVDTAFAVGTGFDNTVFSLAPAADGSGDLYVGGGFTSYNGTPSNRIIRLNFDGTVDAAFAVGSGFDNPVRAITPAADGSGDLYVGGGFTSYNGTPSNRIIRLNFDGTVDAAFAVGTGFDNTVFSLAPAADGSGDLYVGGEFTSYNGTGSNRVIRLNSDGTVDAAFAVGTGFDNTVFSLAPGADGSGDLYVGGDFTSYNGTPSNSIIRLNSDGTVDTAFAVGSGFAAGPVQGVVLALVQAPDGSGDLYVGGLFASYNGTPAGHFIRLNSDGSVETTFAAGSGFTGMVWTLALPADGSGDLYVGGAFTSYNSTGSNRIIRLNSDGTVDAAFAVGSGFDNDVRAIMPAADGSGDLYVGGLFTSYNGTPSNGIIRLNSDGTVDTAFAVGTGFDNAVFSLAPAADGSGDLYVGGAFTSYNGTGSNGIIRLNSDGTVDTAFAVGTGFDSFVRSLAPAADGSGDVFVGGEFTLYKGVKADFIARLRADGTWR